MTGRSTAKITAATPGSKIRPKSNRAENADKAKTVNLYRTNRKRIKGKLRKATQSELGQYWTDEELTPAAPAWGDYMSEYTPHCRVVHQNVNGLDYKNEFCDGHLLGEVMKENSIDIMGMVETKVDWTKERTIERLQKNLRAHLKQVQVSTSSSDVTFETPFQPGGTATLVRGEWAGRTRIHADTSGMGRWSEIEILGKDNTAVRIVTAYRVCSNSTKTPGTMSARYQQTEVMKTQGIRNPDPRAKVLEDLGNRITELKTSGEEVILMMDANDTTQKANSDLSRWAEKVDLVDPHIQRHGSIDEPATHERGSDRIDYIFMTEKISEYVMAAGILEFHKVWKTDHRALYIDIDLEAFLGGRPSPLEVNANRGLMSNDPRAVKIYREHLLKNLEECGIEEKFQKLLDDVEANSGKINKELADRADELDDMFTAVKLESEKECRRVKSFPWSPKLCVARVMVTYWKLWISQHKLKIDYSAKRNKIEEDLALMNIKVKF
jgi:exonuclease III